jgi:thiol-disulfide isomerase/thioredoxin
MKLKIVILTTIIGLAALAWYGLIKPRPANNLQSEQTVATNTASPANSPARQTNTQHNEQNHNSNGDLHASFGNYGDYSPDTVATEQRAGHKVVLFFHAPWCPFCRAADVAFKEKASQIPAGVTVLKIDYDSNKELRTKYGITYQHTFVQIDNNGELVSKWNGGDVDNLIKYLK